MQIELEAFLENPTAINYRRVRSKLKSYRVDMRQYVVLEQLFRDGEFSQVMQQADRMMPAWALSARVHYLAGAAALEVGDLDNADLERLMWHCCLQGMLQSGNGTADKPFPTCYPGDQSELLAWLQLDAERRHVSNVAGRTLDRVFCEDGTQLLFELPELVVVPRPKSARYASSVQN